MSELLKHYAEKLEQLSADFGLLGMQDAVETYNRPLIPQHYNLTLFISS